MDLIGLNLSSIVPSFSSLFKRSSVAYSDPNKMLPMTNHFRINTGRCSTKNKFRVVASEIPEPVWPDKPSPMEYATPAFNAGPQDNLKKIMILGVERTPTAQACETLKKEGYKVVLYTSDEGLANERIVEGFHGSMELNCVDLAISHFRPDALWPIPGDDTALKVAIGLAESGALEKYNVKLIGLDLKSIRAVENGNLVRQAAETVGLKTALTGIGDTVEDCTQIAEELGYFPLVIKPAYPVPGFGDFVAQSMQELKDYCASSLGKGGISRLVVEKPFCGWKKYEVEILCDQSGNVDILCPIQKFTDSIMVAPAQTVTQRLYQRLRRYSIKIMRDMGIKGGGYNMKFAVNPSNREVVLVGISPTSWSSLYMAAMATGYHMAEMAGKLAVGYSLDQIMNDKKVPATSFKSSLADVVTKISKSPGSKLEATQGESVEEAIATGRTFQESFQNAVRLLKPGSLGWCDAQVEELNWDRHQLMDSLRLPSPDGIHAMYAAMKKGMTVDDIHKVSYIDKYFLAKLKQLVNEEQRLLSRSLSHLTKEYLCKLEKLGFSDKQIAFAMKSTEGEVQSKRLSFGLTALHKQAATHFEENFHKNKKFTSGDKQLETKVQENQTGLRLKPSLSVFFKIFLLILPLFISSIKLSLIPLPSYEGVLVPFVQSLVACALILDFPKIPVPRTSLTMQVPLMDVLLISLPIFCRKIGISFEIAISFVMAAALLAYYCHMQVSSSKTEKEVEQNQAGQGVELVAFKVPLNSFTKIWLSGPLRFLLLLAQSPPSWLCPLWKVSALSVFGYLSLDCHSTSTSADLVSFPPQNHIVVNVRMDYSSLTLFLTANFALSTLQSVEFLPK